MSGISALCNVSNDFDSDIGIELPELKAKPRIINKTAAILLTAAKIISQSVTKNATRRNSKESREVPPIQITHCKMSHFLRALFRLRFNCRSWLNNKKKKKKNL